MARTDMFANHADAGDGGPRHDAREIAVGWVLAARTQQTLGSDDMHTLSAVCRTSFFAQKRLWLQWLGRGLMAREGDGAAVIHRSAYQVPWESAS